MIDYINHRLVLWAEWATRRDDGGLGYPRQAHYTKAVLTHSRGCIEEIDEAAMEMERAVQALGHALPMLRIAANENALNVCLWIVTWFEYPSSVPKRIRSFPASS